MNTPLLIVLAIAALGATVAGLLRSRSRRPGWPQPEAAHRVSHDAEEILHRLPDGKVERISWDELVTVEILTTDEGPAACDVFWVFKSRNGEKGCLIPQGSTGELDLLDRLQRLPGFDNQKLVEAMGCTDNRQFLVWRRPGV